MGIVFMAVFGIVILMLGLTIIIKLSRRRRLTSFHSAKLKQLWAQMETNPNPAMKVIEADKILDQALKYLGFEGSLGDKLKTAGPRFSDLNAVWSAHKLRNRIWHTRSTRIRPMWKCVLRLARSRGD